MVARSIGIVSVLLAISLALTATFFPAKFPVTFWAIAIAVSTFYAFAAVTIFVPPDNAPSKAVTWGHQIWLNFLGCALGWCMLYIVLHRLVPSLGGQPDQLDIGDFGLIIVAFVGITGHLPYAVITPLAELVKKAVELASKK